MCAWTAPADFTVSEVVTAAKLNAQLRDNMKYLKGLSGAVAIESEISATMAQTRLLTLVNSGGTPKLYLGINTNAGAVFDLNRDPTAGTIDDAAKCHARLTMDGSGSSSLFLFNTASAVNTLATEKMRITGDGKVGIGRQTPMGALHGYGTIGGFLSWEYDGVDGTARTVIQDGAGDVVYGIVGMFAVRGSGGTTRGGTFSGAALTLLTPGNTQDLYNVSGTDVMQIQVAANGSVTVQRTAGTLTYKVALWLIWI